MREATLRVVPKHENQTPLKVLLVRSTSPNPQKKITQNLDSRLQDKIELHNEINAINKVLGNAADGVYGDSVSPLSP